MPIKTKTEYSAPPERMAEILCDVAQELEINLPNSEQALRHFEDHIITAIKTYKKQARHYRQLAEMLRVVVQGR